MATLSLESLRHSLSQAASTVYPFSGDDDESDSDSFESSFGASSASLTLSGSSPVSVKNGQSPHEKKDAQRMLRAKLFVLTVLMLSACVIGITLFFVVRKENKENFESEVSTNKQSQKWNLGHLCACFAASMCFFFCSHTSYTISIRMTANSLFSSFFPGTVTTVYSGSGTTAGGHFATNKHHDGIVYQTCTFN